MGTELQRRGQRTLLPLWSANALINTPDLTRQIHSEYVLAGAEVLTANSFRTSRYTLAKTNMEYQAEALTYRAVQLAREAAASAPRSQKIRIAGSIAPLEDCYRPDLVPSDDVLRREHLAQAGLLADAGVDLLLVETQNNIREARIAAEAALAQRIPVWVSLCPKDGQTLLSGESLREAIRTIAQLKPEAILVNCCPPPIAREAVRILGEEWDGLWGAYPNFGIPEDETDSNFAEFLSPTKFAEWGIEIVSDGAQIIGGCCGTRVDHIAKLASSLKKLH
ncbi:homocysteine S-methyltransferase family protein [bacterium]|nr:homocysteine S-methyltransferase family protein [bacterium]